MRHARGEASRSCGFTSRLYVGERHPPQQRHHWYLRSASLTPTFPAWSKLYRSYFGCSIHTQTHSRASHSQHCGLLPRLPWAKEKLARQTSQSTGCVRMSGRPGEGGPPLSSPRPGSEASPNPGEAGHHTDTQGRPPLRRYPSV